jgi:hypothetical protein
MHEEKNLFLMAELVLVFIYEWDNVEPIKHLIKQFGVAGKLLRSYRLANKTI